MSYRPGTEASVLPLIAAGHPSTTLADGGTTDVAIDVGNDTVLPQKTASSEEQMKLAELKDAASSIARKRNGMKVVFRVSFMASHLGDQASLSDDRTPTLGVPRPA